MPVRYCGYAGLAYDPDPPPALEEQQVQLRALMRKPAVYSPQPQSRIGGVGIRTTKDTKDTKGSGGRGGLRRLFRCRPLNPGGDEAGPKVAHEEGGRRRR